MELQAFYKSEGAQINIKHYDHESDTRDVEESTRSKGEKNLKLFRVRVEEKGVMSTITPLPSPVSFSPFALLLLMVQYKSLEGKS